MYPNPYLISKTPKIGLLSKSFNTLKSVNWGSLLEGTQKTLGVINQVIPIAYQIKPIINNAKTIFKIAGSIKDDTPPTPISNPKAENTHSEKKAENVPIFYI